MELRHIDIANLCVSAANMRGRAKPNVSDLLPSVRARGVLVPLIVRQNGTLDTFEIVAGKRRYYAALAVADEAGGIEALPCAVIEAGDDAAALEASLIENIARLDPDEVTRWETFTRLVREGRTPEQLSQTFGLTDLQVKRTLALGNLLPRIRNLYRHGEIDAASVRHLTFASKAQQREWLTLVSDDPLRCPTGQRLKAWLFGGASIPVANALFDLDSYTGEIVSDLFGDERYFACASEFWTAQNAAIEARADAYREAGWSEVVLLPAGQPFYAYEHQRTPKRKGGRVYVSIDHRGAITFHEGYLTFREARRIERDNDTPKPVRPEITSGIGNYGDLHRHAAVRAKLADASGVALRLMVAHAITGSPLWRVRIEPQLAASDPIAESVESCASEAAFDAKRRIVLDVLGFDPETPTVTGGYAGEGGLPALFQLLCGLTDAQVLDVLAIVMGETLTVATPMIELLGPMLEVSMAEVWQADDALLDQLRDREVLDAVLAEVAGETVAAANASAKVKVKRRIVRDCLTGENGRAKVEGWVPKWMRFPPAAYTPRGGVGSVRCAEQLTAVMAPEPGRGCWSRTTRERAHRHRAPSHRFGNGP
jgi:ParB family chromosome partitioning protein